MSVDEAFCLPDEHRSASGLTRGVGSVKACTVSGSTRLCARVLSVGSSSQRLALAQIDL